MSPSDPRPPQAPDTPRTWKAIRGVIRRVAPSRYREAFLGDLIEEWETVIRPQNGSAVRPRRRYNARPARDS